MKIFLNLLSLVIAIAMMASLNGNFSKALVNSVEIKQQSTTQKDSSTTKKHVKHAKTKKYKTGTSHKNTLQDSVHPPPKGKVNP